MTKQEFRQLIEQKIVVLDGATGSMLQKAGMKSGVCPESWILDHPEVLIQLQYDYLQAGTDIIYAPTFTSNRTKLSEYGLEQQMESINHSLVQLSKEAVKRYQAVNQRTVYVAGDITMTGQQLEPYGVMKLEELIQIYKEQMKFLAAAGVDLFVVETMLSLQECRAALIAAKETCDLPVMVSMTFNEDGRTLYGTSPETAIVVLQSLGADAVGVNCSVGPKKMCEVLAKMKPYARVPLIAKPNAGLPHLLGEETIFSLDAPEFEQECKHFFELGIHMIGGCCGTTPEHIQRIAAYAKKYPIPKVITGSIRALSTERSLLPISLDGRFLVVGERINPTGKKALQAELKEGILDMVSNMANVQVEEGADLLDLNMGMNGINEKQMMLNVMKEVISQVDVPLSIDSSHIDVIEAALREYPGRALINSISLEKEKLERLIPIAKKYGAMFILLPLSEAGLPRDMEEKKKIIHTILERAYAFGLTNEDIIVDGLVNTIGANKQASLQTMETIRYCREELGVATIVGLSNISFGLPERQFVNSTFLAFAIQAGLTMAIANPGQDLLMNTAFAADLLRNKEDADTRYINRMATHAVSVTSATQAKQEVNPLGGENSKPAIYETVMKGNRRVILAQVEEELKKNTKASAILDEMLIPAIQEVGHLFDVGTYFLPQLIASAETMKTAIDRLEPLLQEKNQGKSAGTIVIATVAGDIHDIGKNLVALMLKNYGFQVIDLGKDVDSAAIIETARQHQADIIALSALMTTTMLEMKNVVKLRNEQGLSAKIIIGGAVITQSYCEEIGADGYSKDAQEAVVLVKRLLNID